MDNLWITQSLPVDNFDYFVDNLWITWVIHNLSTIYPQTYPQVIHILKVFLKAARKLVMTFEGRFGELSTAPTTTTIFLISLKNM